ncbi:MAG: serine hydrolase domain-containing protein [Gammaproteobacteria bacterium]
MPVRFRTSLAFTVAALLFAVAAWAREMPTATPDEVGLSTERLIRIGQVFKNEIDQGKLPGAVMLVARKGKIAYFESLGVQSKDSGQAMPKNAIFRIYSMTKPIVSVAAMILAEEGKLQLNDPVGKFLPGFDKLQVSAAKTDAEFAKVAYTTVPTDRPMTVQDLLRHTSGLAYGELTANTPVKDAYTKAGLWSADMDFDIRALTPAEEIERLAKAPLAHQPGTVWEYSFATDVLGRVVEAASGMRLADFLAERVFKPLGMDDTGFWVPADKISRLAQPFATDPATNKPNKLIDVSAQPKNDSGGAGGVSTALDYLRFSQMLLNGGQLDGARIVSRTTVNLMTSDHLGKRITAATTPGELLLGTPGYTFGLGFAVREGAGVASVPGSAGEFMWGGYGGTYFWIDPQEQLVGVLMTQAPGPSRQFYRRLFKQLVYQAIAD